MIAIIMDNALGDMPWPSSNTSQGGLLTLLFAPVETQTLELTQRFPQFCAGKKKPGYDSIDIPESYSSTALAYTSNSMAPKGQL